MNRLEKLYLDRALFWKDQYKSVPFYLIKRRREYKMNWINALDLMAKHQKND